MKANELMIGDCVRHKRTKEVISIFEIDDDRNVINNEPDGYCSEKNINVDDVEPIPLTPEILEKNGFTDWADHSRTTRSCSMLVDKTNIIVQKIDGTDYIFTQIHRGGDDSCEFRMDLKYVHELQHVLKLCHIEKTIEL